MRDEISHQCRPCENVASEGKTRQKQARKRSLRVVNEHSEPVFNAGLSSAVVFTRPAWHMPCTGTDIGTHANGGMRAR
ncbi:hypothetical protein C1Y08_07020 [Pseudomonas sp. FW306-02-F02-AA]|nr:hypothetical protein C1Y07_08455 [Pseudomonas sp. FW306-02-F02-AB]PMZ09404.1 hypothetical protein C1Y06_14635 [Pseudomonas sp. FW306-02-H06C]PMZ16534.1 hypothetical protein C1Y08_07020 [Pseudomonas sp. FW306-02-F02-AA]PMZ21056.1 hypothetical protein C1Y09_15955 [Pseudomonas sp. FW306-02-F08-AA]PMZ27896.1 hypothetical protein C1Y05_10035 [Pseudomonas sp. FW306-02-F04-BA]PMZ35128.1 hypothetical protein C1X99_08385 [Pseudomonas sp. FW306-02-H06B]PMZ40832.1 hypothetical protein C1Y00_10305 [Ps